MMAEFFKGMPMFKSLVVLVGTALLLPAWAQSQGQSGAKAQPYPLSAQAKARADADITARLQARAIAEAQALATADARVALRHEGFRALGEVGAASVDGVGLVLAGVVAMVCLGWMGPGECAKKPRARVLTGAMP